jgi:hypothetical protein
MKLATGVLCTDPPTIRPDGRADLAGIYHRLVAPSFPSPIVGYMFLSFRVGPEDFGANRMTFDIQLINESGGRAALPPSTVDVERRGKEGVGSVFLALDVSRIQVNELGAHEFVVWANLHQVASVPFQVVPKP